MSRSFASSTRIDSVSLRNYLLNTVYLPIRLMNVDVLWLDCLPIELSGNSGQLIAGRLPPAQRYALDAR